MTVNLTDSTGKTQALSTNGAGNFYATPSQWMPTYPVHVTLDYQGQTVKMSSRVGRDGSCAGCHFDPQGPTSPGHVYLTGAAP